MTEQKKHPNHEWIVAFADGEELQWRTNPDDFWTGYVTNNSFGPWITTCEWRVKPKSRWYRVASFKDANGKFWTESADSGTLDEEVFTTDGEFVEWLTDRVEYET